MKGFLEYLSLILFIVGGMMIGWGGRGIYEKYKVYNKDGVEQVQVVEIVNELEN